MPAPLECPDHGPVKPASMAGLFLVLFVLGFFTCGLTWLLTPIVPLTRWVAPTCPVCGQELRRRRLQ